MGDGRLKGIRRAKTTATATALMNYNILLYHQRSTSDRVLPSVAYQGQEATAAHEVVEEADRLAGKGVMKDPIIDLYPLGRNTKHHPIRGGLINAPCTESFSGLLIIQGRGHPRHSQGNN